MQAICPCTVKYRFDSKSAILCGLIPRGIMSWRLLQRHVASLFSRIGAVNSALEIFLPLEMWDDVIRSYASLGRREKAEQTIRERLAVEETPQPYCYLGDVTEDPQHYEKAWQMSEGRSGRAKRSLAFYHLRRSEVSCEIPTLTH